MVQQWCSSGRAEWYSSGTSGLSSTTARRSLGSDAVLTRVLVYQLQHCYLHVRLTQMLGIWLVLDPDCKLAFIQGCAAVAQSAETEHGKAGKTTGKLGLPHVAFC